MAGECIPKIIGYVSAFVPRKGVDYWTDEDKAEIAGETGNELGLKVVSGKLCAVYEKEEAEE